MSRQGEKESQGRRGVSIDHGSGLGGSGELSHLGVIPAEFPVLSLSRQLLKTFRLSLTTFRGSSAEVTYKQLLKPAQDGGMHSSPIPLDSLDSSS